MNQTSPRLLTIGCFSLFVFMYAPLLVVIVFSLTPTEYGVSWQGFTLKWYQAVFDNKNIQAALKVSLMVTIPAVL
ncbi:MAG: spermidine/putrescine ABC transporter permease PotC, partial [Verrucomicrobia bacterium]|nr:spermidine/putrescine ABC transporter permease PotC [Verrucomicrobiota bacterium]